VNKKSTQKEPQHWAEQLLRQGISRTILGFIQQTSSQALQTVTRSKKAAVCLYYISGVAMSEIENAVSQFGGGFGGSAGPIMSVTERTCDVLPTIARAAELLHPGLQLGDRASRLTFRLAYGIQGPAVDLARYAERSLDRADYKRLCDASCTGRERLTASDDATLLPLLANDQRKLTAIRAAVTRWSQARPVRPAVPLPQYEA
jgi:ATP-dependent DNA helicase